MSKLSTYYRFNAVVNIATPDKQSALYINTTRSLSLFFNKDVLFSSIISYFSYAKERCGLFASKDSPDESDETSADSSRPSRYLVSTRGIFTVPRGWG